LVEIGITGTPARLMKGSELLVRALELEGVEYIFGVPGEENLDMLEAIRTSSIRLIVTRHEQVAGFMAATYGRLTGTPGVCLSTLGPGATNLVTAAAYASLGGMPMLMITGQKSIFDRRQARFQIVDTVAMMRPLTKSARQIIETKSIPNLVLDAFRTAIAERPGPVHLELPEDIAAESICDPHFAPTALMYPSIASGDSINQAVAALAAARHPLIVIGGGANRPGQTLRLSAAVQQLGIPFVNTQMGKGAINGNSDLFIGTAALSSGDYVHVAVDRADLLVVVGHDTVEKPPFLMRPGGPTVIHIAFSPAEIDQIYFPQIEVVGDIADSMSRLANEVGGRRSKDEALACVQDLVLERTADGCNDPRYPLAPQRVVSDVRRVMPEDGILCLDNGMYKIWFARNYRTRISNTILLDNALATMGAGLPSAMMAAMLHPSRRVMAVCGDGGFMMNSQDLETAVRLGLNLVVLIIEDKAYGMIRWKQQLDGFPDFGLTFNNPDFVQYAQAYGATGSRIASTDEFAPTLQSAFEVGGVQIVVAPIDYSENQRVLVDELNAKSILAINPAA
jgi:acetolactate synthase I/II/III large subunit